MDEHNYDNCPNVTCRRKNEERGVMEFLMDLEYIAIASGFRLCMERAPIGCGIMFYFRDVESGLRSSDIWFHRNHDSIKELSSRLKQLATEFRTRLDENKESFEVKEE